MRLKSVLSDNHNIQFDFARNYLIINKCEIFSTPSHNLNSLRSLENVKCILISEAEYMPKLSEVRQNCERFLTKSSPIIIYESTIRSATGLYAEIFREEPSLYTKKVINWQDCLNEGMFTAEMLRQASKSRSYSREILCDLYGASNVVGTFPHEWVRRAFEMNEDIQPNEFYLGLDSGWSPARFGVSLIGKNTRTGKKQIIVCDEYEENEDNMLELIVNLKNTYNVKNIFIDANDKRMVKKIKKRVPMTQLNTKNTRNI